MFHVNIKDGNAACLARPHRDKFGVPMPKQTVYFGRISSGVIEARTAFPFTPAGHFPFCTTRKNVIAAVLSKGFGYIGKFNHARFGGEYGFGHRG